MVTESPEKTQEMSGRTARTIAPFSLTLAKHGLDLSRAETTTLQVNVGLLCNQACRHCHLEAGPGRDETMSAATARQVADFAGRHSFQVIDVTGGATELNPHLCAMVEWFAACAPAVMLRSNLTLLAESAYRPVLETCRKHRAIIVGSLPSTNVSQLEAQRGRGVLEKSISTLKKLNSIGYGQSGSGLELNLVANPSGAFLPISQAQAEKKFRVDLQRKWGVVFNQLFTFANVPLGRFKAWLTESGNYGLYVERLSSSFNPCIVEGLMCRRLISVSWDGYLYDCDFNQAAGLPWKGSRTHISELKALPPKGTPIAVSDHCYACTAGAGFT
jgi:radical SAM/Cys-rich protein